MDTVGSYCLPPKSNQEEHLAESGPTRIKSHSKTGPALLSPRVLL